MHAGFGDGRRLSGVASFVQQMDSANGVGNAVEAVIANAAASASGPHPDICQISNQFIRGPKLCIGDLPILPEAPQEK